MTTGAIVLSWGTPVRGRESKAVEVFGRALQLSEEFAKEGMIHGHHEYLTVTGNAQKFGGFQLLEGDLERLMTLQMDERMRKLEMEASTIVDNFTVTVAIGGSDQAIQNEMAQYMDTMQGMGYGT